MTEWNREDSGLYQHAKSELDRAALLAPDSDYDGFLGECTLALVEVFAQQGHSGGSAEMVLALFDNVAHFRPLSPITADPDEWFQHDASVVGDDAPLWQNKRRSSAFSNDGGRSYYLVDEPTDGGTPTMYTSDPNYPTKNQENESA